MPEPTTVPITDFTYELRRTLGTYLHARGDSYVPFRDLVQAAPDFHAMMTHPVPDALSDKRTLGAYAWTKFTSTGDGLTDDELAAAIWLGEEALSVLDRLGPHFGLAYRDTHLGLSTLRSFHNERTLHRRNRGGKDRAHT